MREGTCKRFFGGGQLFGWVTRLPCHIANDAKTTCEKYEEPTREEIEASVSECFECDGKGFHLWITGDLVECRKCGGTGIIISTQTAVRDDPVVCLVLRQQNEN